MALEKEILQRRAETYCVAVVKKAERSLRFLTSLELFIFNLCFEAEATIRCP